MSDDAFSSISAGPDLPKTLAQDVAEILLDLLAIDTQNPPGETTALAEYVESYLTERGIETRRVTANSGKPNVLARIFGAADRRFLYNGHFDTVPFDADAWSHDPLGERVDDRIYGRGSTDMKGPLASMLLAADAFATREEPPPLDLVFAFVSDEEVPSDAGLEAVLEATDLHASACVIGENTCGRGQHSVTVADRGSIWLTLDATGEGAHGSRPVFGVNAIDRLYDAVDHLRSSLLDRTLSLSSDFEAVLADSVEFYGPMIGREQARQLFTYPTVNLGTIEGGESINSVPEHASARVDVRIAASVDTKRVLDDIRTCLGEHEGVTIEEVSWSQGTLVDPDGPLATSVVETAESVVDERVYRRSATGGGDTKTLRNAGIPTVEFGLGSDTVHAVDEYITLDALAANTVIYTALPAAYIDRVRDASAE
ncbi:MAG: M20 family metallopeptidase [Halanaeroarchaeum sp.]